MTNRVHTAPCKVASEDVVRVLPEQKILYQECCDCGLQHRIEILSREPVLKLRFVNIGRDAAAADCAAQGYSGFETHVEDAQEKAK